MKTAPPKCFYELDQAIQSNRKLALLLLRIYSHEMRAMVVEARNKYNKKAVIWKATTP